MYSLKLRSTALWHMQHFTTLDILFKTFGLFALKDFQIIGISNIWTMNVSDHGIPQTRIALN
jgi:hypothetical protein